jgi:hypothetical protein
MKLSHSARLIAGAALVLSTAGAASPLTASAAMLSAHPTYQTDETAPEQFAPPAAPGETTVGTSSEAVEAAEPVEEASAETGVDRPMMTDDEDDDED